MKFRWNDQEVNMTTIYDVDAESEKPFLMENSLKTRLQTVIGGRRADDLLVDIGKGLAQIMDYIEKKENDKS